jgi:hypothetical protein
MGNLVVAWSIRVGYFFLPLALKVSRHPVVCPTRLPGGDTMASLALSA